MTFFKTLFRVALLSAAPLLGSVSMASADGEYGQCVDSCKSAFWGQTYDKQTTMGACDAGCHDVNWIGEKRAIKECRSDYAAGSSLLSACLQGVAFWP